MAFTRFQPEEAGPYPGGAGRRWLAIVVIAAVALAGALLGQMSVVRDDAARPTPPGPLDALPL